MNLIDHCRKFIATDSSTHQGNKEMAELAGAVCEEAGLTVDYQSESHKGLEQLNIIARPKSFKGSQDELMLQNHLDTVDPGVYSAWTKTAQNPFNASIIDNRIYGLGTAGVKLDFLCKIFAAKEFSQASFSKRSFVLVGTFGEEHGAAGAVKLIRRKKVSSKLALIGEPTSLSLAHEGPGSVVIEISVPFSKEEQEYQRNHDLMESSYSQSKIFTGRAAHASYPELGENAIVKMLEYLSNLPDGIAVMDLDGGFGHNSVPSNAILEVDLVDEFKDSIIPKLKVILEAMKKIEGEFKSFTDSGFSPPHTTMNLGHIKTFEEYVRMKGMVRLTPSVTKETYEAWMDHMRKACKESGATFRIIEYKQPFSTPKDSEFLMGCQEILKDMGTSEALTKTAAGTEASVFARTGVECIVFGPGVAAGNTHAPNESVSIDELKTAIEFYKSVLTRFCS